MSALGSLVVKLALEYAQFTGGLERSEQAALQRADRIQRAMDDMGRRVSGAMKAAAMGVAAGAALAGAALGAMVNETMTAAVDIERMAAMAGSSNADFQIMAAGAKSVGLEMDKFSDIAKDVQDKMGDYFVTGGGELADFFDSIAPKVGVTAEQFRHLSGPEAMQLFYSTLEKANVGQAVMIQQMESLASDSSTLAPLLANNGEGFKLMGDQAQRAGSIMSDDLIYASKALNIELAGIKTLMTGVATEISSAVIPMLVGMAQTAREDMASGFETVSAWVADNKTQLLGVWDATKALAVQVWGLLEPIAGVAVGIGKWMIESGAVQVVLESVGLMVAGLKDGVTVLGAAFAGVGSVILRTILNPLKWYLTAISKVQGFLGNADSAASFASAAASIESFSEAGGQYAAGVVAQFANGESAVAKFKATMGQSTAATLANVRKTRDALSSLGTGAGLVSTKDAAEAAKKATAASGKSAAAAQKAIDEAAKLAAAGLDLANSLTAQNSGLSSDFAKKWDSLSAAYKAGSINLDLLTSSQAALLAQQPAMKEAQDVITKAAEAAAQSLKSVGDRVTGLEDEAAALDLSRAQNVSLAEAVELLALARLQEAQAAKFAAGSDGWATVQKEIDARKQLIGLMSTKSLREKEESGWTEIWQSVESTAHDTFTNIFEGGQDAFTKLKNVLKTGLLDLLYQMTVKKWIFNIGASVTAGTGMSSTANASTSLGSGGGGSSLGSLMNIAGQIKSVYSTITGGFTALGDSVAFAADEMGAWLVQNTTGTLNSAGSSLMSSAGTLGTAATYAGAALAGYGIGTAISGKYEAFGNKDFATVAGTAIGMAVAGPIGAVVGGAIGGMVNRAFGTGPKESTGYGMRGSFSSTGASVQNYSSWKKDGGWFRSDKSGTETSAVNAELGKFLNSAVAMTTAATKVYAGAIGLSAAAVDGYTQAINISMQGLDAKGQEEAIGKALSGFGDGMAGVYTGLRALAKDGETAGATLARLGTSLISVNAMFSQLDQTLLAASLSGADAASKLLDAAGGMDSFAQLATGYYDNFYSDEEKRLNTIKAVNAATAGSGLDAASATRASFRALVEAQDVTTDSGRAMYVSLLSASSAFASLSESAATFSDSFKDAASAFSTLQDYMFAQDLANTAIGKAMGRQIGIPGFATGGDFAGGLRVVGENGPELEATGPSRIFNAGQTRAILSGGSSSGVNAELLAEVRALRQEVAQLRQANTAENTAIATATSKAARHLSNFEDRGMPVTTFDDLPLATKAA